MTPDPWGTIATFLSAASPHTNLKHLFIFFRWPILPSQEIDDLSNGCGFVLRNAGALEPIFDKSLKGLLTLEVTLCLDWPPKFYFESDRIRTQLSQSALKEALRKKLPKISKEATVEVSVRHLFR